MSPATNDQNPDPMSPDPKSARWDGGATAKDDPFVERRAPYQPRVVPLWNNTITIIGFFVVMIGVLSLLTFALFSVVMRENNTYVDVVGYLVVPCIMLLGVIIIPFGILFKSWRLHRRDPGMHIAFRFPRIALNDPGQRRTAKSVISG